MIKKHKVEVARDYRCPLCMERGDESTLFGKGLLKRQFVIHVATNYVIFL